MWIYARNPAGTSEPTDAEYVDEYVDGWVDELLGVEVSGRG